jgi:hypothetical protein
MDIKNSHTVGGILNAFVENAVKGNRAEKREIRTLAINPSHSFLSKQTDVISMCG